MDCGGNPDNGGADGFPNPAGTWGNTGKARLQRAATPTTEQAGFEPAYETGSTSIRFPIVLEPHGEWRALILVSGNIDGHAYKPLRNGDRDHLAQNPALTRGAETRAVLLNQPQLHRSARHEFVTRAVTVIVLVAVAALLWYAGGVLLLTFGGAAAGGAVGPVVVAVVGSRYTTHRGCARPGPDAVPARGAGI